MRSNAIFEALGQCLKSPIYYIVQVNHNGEEYFVALSKHSMFFIESKLEEVKTEIFYAHIIRILLDPDNVCFLQIQFSDNRDENIPAKMNLATEERKQFTDWLRVCWKTDYMFRIGYLLIVYH